MTPLTYEEWQEMQEIHRDTCKHENADHLMPGESHGDYWHGSEAVAFVAQCEQLRCLDCGAWCSLGASNDRPTRVKIEIRAVEIAADVVSRRFAQTRAEVRGWRINALHAVDRKRAPRQQERAGWLAYDLFNDIYLNTEVA